jgi:SAM-dependent methyltransferase
MPSSTPIDVTEIMREIRERVRRKATAAAPFELPSVSFPLLTALDNARGALSELKSSVEQIDELPPRPQTVRGALGSFLSRFLRRLLFWQYAQARKIHVSVVKTIEQLIVTSETISSHNEQLEASIRSLSSKVTRLAESSQTIQRLTDDTERISEENEKLRADLHSTTQRLAEVSDMVTAATEQASFLGQTAEAIQNEIDNQASLRSQESKTLTEKIAKIDRYALRTRRDVVLQEQRINSVLRSVRKYAQVIEPVAEDSFVTTSIPDSMAGLYLALEDAFRGSPDDIAERVSEYLPILEQAGLNHGTDLVIDIGCGRGEWLRVLSQKGYRNKGCDSNEVMVDTCREQGLDAVQQDALQFLGSLPNDSVAAVTAFHVIEHLPLSSVLALIDGSLRVLRPGGLLILETPNPQNILVASHNFYIDPTHRKPVPMILLQFLVEERGFCDIRPLSLHPYPEAALVEGSSEVARRFNEYFYGSQDYAIIAVKP